MRLPKNILPILIVAIIILGSTSAISLSMFAVEPKAGLNLYYENRQATAPINIKLEGTWGTQEATGRCLFGVVRGYRSISGSVTLKIGNHYEQTKTPTFKITYAGQSISSRYSNWKLTVTATFEVPASSLVQYMTLKVDAEGEPIPDEGTLPFQISMQFTITGFTGKGTFSKSGTANIKIVGDVSQYVLEESPELPEETPPDELEEPDSSNIDLPETPETPELVNSGSVNTEGGSSLYGISGFAISPQLLLIGIVVVVVIVIIFGRW